MSLAWLVGMHHATAKVATLYITYMQFIQPSLCPELQIRDCVCAMPAGTRAVVKVTMLLPLLLGSSACLIVCLDLVIANKQYCQPCCCHAKRKLFFFFVSATQDIKQHSQACGMQWSILKICATAESQIPCLTTGHNTS